MHSPLCAMSARLACPFLTFALLHLLLLLLFSNDAHSFPHSTTLSTATVAANVSDDVSSLLAFKALISNDPFGALSSWKHNVHHCQWQGVTCGGRRHPDRVTALEIDSHNLTGSLSPHLTNLTFLRWLGLPNNFFHGRIPPELCRGLRRLQHINLTNNLLEGDIPPTLPLCSRLQYLGLSRNKLDGEIPANISSCLELRMISLSFNRFVGAIPLTLGLLPRLEKLSVAVNSLTGSIPPSLGNLSSLTVLDGSQNSLWGSIPATLGKLHELTYLEFQGSGLWGKIPSSLFNLSYLSLFNVAGNQFSGTLPNDLGTGVPNLQFLWASGNMLEGHIPLSLANASSLQQILFSKNRLRGRVPENIGNLPYLSRLAIDDNQVGAGDARDWDFLTSLANCTGLQVLDLVGNRFGGVLPQSLFNLSAQLTWLALGSNPISGSIPSEIGRFIHLTSLYLDESLLSGVVPDSIGNLRNLRVMYLEENNFSGELPPSLGNLSQLNILDISHNKLEGSIPPSFGNLRSLELLDLAYNELNGTIPGEAVSLPSLSMYLNLSYNSLAGPLPPEVGKLINLQTLDVSNNLLSGELPSSLSGCVILEYLYMQGNLFQGNIPSSLGDLKGLTQLDLSRNNLSGSIPESFKGFRLLQKLNLSFNILEGLVPVEGPFANASVISINGNKNLCGGIPQLRLQPCPTTALHRKHGLSIKLKVIISTATIFTSALLILLCVVLWKKSRSKKELPQPSSMEGLMKISYEELFKATDGFSSANLIGTGSFGYVYKGIVDFEPKVVAVKVLNLIQGGASKSFQAECKAIKNIRHRNLIKIITACSSLDRRGNDFKALVLEFMPNGSLDEWLHPNGRPSHLSLVQRLNIAIDVALALDYLHHRHGQVPIVHCDLKPSNVLLDHDMSAHVSDFGLARFLPKPISSSSQDSTSSIKIKGSIGYVAPEYGMGSKASTQADVYSYGILLLEMFTGKRPTDEMFVDGMNLHKFVSAAYPEAVMDIVDPLLTLQEEEEDVRNLRGQETERLNEKMQQCLIAIIKVGLTCSMESPKERTEMGEVVGEMLAIQKSFGA